MRAPQWFDEMATDIAWQFHSQAHNVKTLADRERFLLAMEDIGTIDSLWSECQEIPQHRVADYLHSKYYPIPYEPRTIEFPRRGKEVAP